MRSLTRAVLVTFSVMSVGFFAPLALAAGDMLQPDEIQTTGISANPANDSSFFFGGGLNFGQAYTTEEGASPGFSVLAGIEPGYQVNTGSWSRFEVSGKLFTGTMSFRVNDLGGKISMPINFGLLAKAGLGYSLGGKMFGVARAGAGVVQAKWKADDVGGVSAESTSAMSGFVGLLGWDVVAPISGNFDFVGGISLMHMQFDLNEIKAAGVKDSIDRPVIVNLPQVELGLRVRL